MAHLVSSFSLWELFFTAFGIGSFLYALGALFLPFGNHADRFFVSEFSPAGSPQFLKAISRMLNAPLERGGKAAILNNGTEFLPALLKDFDHAQHTISITVYIWEEGQFSKQVVVSLMKALARKVEVRILLDAFGAHGMPQKVFEELTDAGAIIHSFRTPRYGMYTRFHRRNHRRAIIIDGVVGYLGGMAIADKWLGEGAPAHSWRDFMVRVEGCLVSHVQSAFSQLWAATCGEILAGDHFYPATPHDNSPLISLNLVSSPTADTEPLPKFFWYSLASATKRVYLTTPYLVPSKHIRHVLVDIARRGIEVMILVPSSRIDSAIVRLAGEYYYRGLLAGGVRIFAYKPSMLHSKALVIDGVWSVVGSANLDSRSLLLNEENVIGIADEQFAKTMEAMFEKDLQSSKEITLSQWQKRSLLTKALQMLCARFAKQF